MFADRRAVVQSAEEPGTGAARLVHWVFYAYVFSLPFEFPERSIPVEYTTITGAVFLLATLLQPRVCFRRPPAPFWLFAVYMYAIVASFALNGADYPQETIKTLIVRTQLIVLLLVSYNLMRDPRVARNAMIILALACVLLGSMMLTGIVGMVDEVAQPRVTAFGQNPNRSALLMAAATVVLIGMGFAGVRPPFRPRLLVLGLAAVTVVAQLNTGSRGSLLALALGLWTLSLGGTGFRLRFRNAVVGLVGTAALGLAVMRSPMMVERLRRAQQGDFAGREEIFPTAWGMFQERPFFGWSSAGNKYELALRISDGVHLSRDTHNLGLELITTVGLVGAVPFVAALLWCVFSAWRARHGPLGIVPFALCAVTMAGNMSGNYIVLKLMWLVLALALASRRLMPAAASPEPRAPAPVPRRRPWSLPTAG